MEGKKKKNGLKKRFKKVRINKYKKKKCKFGLKNDAKLHPEI